MIKMSQLEFWTKTTQKNEILEWTFNGAPTREYTHCYHDYPARMIPQIAAKLLSLFADKAALLFDPYCGTGTSLVEALVKGINAVGTDLNPLARLIAKAKTSTPNPREIDKQLKEFQRFLTNIKLLPQPKSPTHLGEEPKILSGSIFGLKHQ